MKWLKTRNSIIRTIIAVIGTAMAGTVFGQGTPNVVWQKQVNSDRINAVVFSPDGQTFISGSSDRLINLWRASDGALLQTLNTNATKVHESSIEWLAINNDGSKLASCSYKIVKLWTLPAGTEKVLTGHTDWVVGVAFSPGGTYLASASFDGTVKIWRGSDGSLVKTININSGEVRGVSFSPDGNYLASGGGDGAVRIWKTADWSLVATMTGHTSDIYVLTFAPDSATIASGGYDHTVRVWNTGTWTSRYTINAAGNVYALAYTSDSQKLASSDGEANHIELHRVSDGALIKRYDQQVNNVQSIAFSGSGYMGYGRADATVVMSNPGNTSTTQPPPQQKPPPPQTNPPPQSVSYNLVWQHTSGALYGWGMNGTNHVNTFQINNGHHPSAETRLLGLGDLNGDGNTDFVWENATGAVTAWMMDAGTMIGSTRITDGQRADPKWRVAGVGDFNHDGQPDILFRTASGALRTWLTQGLNVIDTEPLLDGTRLEKGWRVAAVGDFNHDGITDLVLQNGQGNVEIQLTKSLSALKLVPLDNNLPTSKVWRVVSAGDVDGDGNTDLFVQSTNGYAAVWFMKGLTFSQSVLLNNGQKVTPGWRIVGIQH